MGEETLAAEAARNDYAIAWSARGNPAQLALLECPIFEVFFGGARGGGKTDGMLGEWVRHADLYGEHAIGLMLRRTRTELIETIERSRAIYGLMGWTYHETDKMWRAPNGGVYASPILSATPTLNSTRGTTTRGSTSRKSVHSRRRRRL